MMIGVVDDNNCSAIHHAKIPINITSVFISPKAYLGPASTLYVTMWVTESLHMH